jgi:hypothetical protein
MHSLSDEESSAALVLTVGLMAVPTAASAITISTDTSGTTPRGPFFWGLVITTPAGGPWDDLTINWYNGATPAAAGDVFLLTQQYLGTPAALSSSTPGFLAEGTASGGVYNFAPTVTLLGGTDYWFYTDTAFVSTGGFGGFIYVSVGPGSGNDFRFVLNTTSNYLLSGAPPAPSSVPDFPV